MKVFVIPHTHWDREWFVTHDFTDELLEEFFENLLKIFEKKEDFVFVLDGQTLILEDYLSRKPEDEERLRDLISSGRLIVGPVYAQIDWRLSPESAIWKNFSIGMRDVERFGGRSKFGWFMDNFGHISQIPQLLRIFGVDWVFIWRGVRLETGKERMFLGWRSPDGSSVKTVFLISGYRNLYNLTDTKDIAQERLKHEIEKVSNFTKVPLLLDGYDLDTHPEDPRDFLSVSIDVNEYLKTLESLEDPIEVEGEMISGKYACVFPGTLSTRSYLKIGADHVGRLLSYLSVLKSDDEKLWREFLKTLLHDNISGVCVDQVHENMETTFRKLCRESRRRLEETLGRLNLKGLYVFNPASFEYDVDYAVEEFTARLHMDGTGVWKIDEIENWKDSSDLNFRNDHYEFRFENGSFYLNGRRIGFYRIEKDVGDTYSSHTEPIRFDEKVEIVSILETSRSKMIKLSRTLNFKLGEVRTEETLLLDSTPLVRWRIVVEPRGVGYKLRIGREVEGNYVEASMPFDVVRRPPVDEDLLPEKIEPPLSMVLLAAREIGSTKDFPFSDFVRVGNGYILSRGLKEYRFEDFLYITLFRSVEWITLPDVPGRVGDAGPVMYVPGARCERRMRFDLAFADLGEDFERWIELFVKYPVIFHSYGERENDLKFFRIDSRWVLLEDDDLIYVENSKMKKTKVDYELPKDKMARVDLITDLSIPFGVDESAPDVGVLKDMKEKSRRLKEELEILKDDLNSKTGLEYRRKMHEYLKKRRELLENELSITLNEIRLGMETFKNVGSLVRELNEARRKRRTYDYIVELYESKEVRG